MAGPQLRTTLEAFQGADFAFGPVFFGYQAPDTTEPYDIVPVDFTDCTANMQVALARAGDAPLILELYAGDDPSQARIEFTSGNASTDPGLPSPPYPNGYAIYIPASVTLNMGRNEDGSTFGNDGAESYQYDLFITFPDGSKQIWQTGTFKLSPSVYRSTA